MNMRTSTECIIIGLLLYISAQLSDGGLAAAVMWLGGAAYMVAALYLLIFVEE